MRYWNGKYMNANYIRRVSALTKEGCMDACLSESKCLVFVYKSSTNDCYLRKHPNGQTLYGNPAYSTGVRCSRLFSHVTPPDGTYPTVESTPGE